MNNGPVPFAREMMAVDSFLRAPPTAEGLMQAFFPAKVADNFDPGDDMKMMLSAFFNTAEGRKIVEWLADLTVRAPYPHVGSMKESAALAAAKHEARTAVGYSLFRAIADGNDLWKQKRSQTYEKST